MDDILLVEYEEEIIAARLNEKMEIAKNFLRKGYSPEDVADAAKLPLSTVTTLQNQLVPA